MFNALIFTARIMAVSCNLHFQMNENRRKVTYVPCKHHMIHEVRMSRVYPQDIYRAFQMFAPGITVIKNTPLCSVKTV